MFTLNRNSLAAYRWSALLLALNFVGAITYVTGASHGWVIPEERAAGMYSVTGEPVVWGAYVFPVCAVFLALNLIWGGFIIARRQWVSGIFWLLAIPIWVVAVVIDFAHH